jgi:hypothetical protein
MDAASNTGRRWMYLPLRAVCLRWCGQMGVDVLEEVADASSEVASTARSTAPLLPQPPFRSLLLDRLRSRPHTYAQVAQLAVQAAQVEILLLLRFAF